MNDQQIISLVRRFKVNNGEWEAAKRPSIAALSKALRAIKRADVAGRLEEGVTVIVLEE